MLREAEGKGWKGFYQFLLSFIAFPTVLGADVYKFMTRPAPNYQFVTNIHNHTDGDVTITKL